MTKRKACVWVMGESCDEFLGQCHAGGWMYRSAHATRAEARESARARRGCNAEFDYGTFGPPPKLRVVKYARAGR
jgi:hypothetical protein